MTTGDAGDTRSTWGKLLTPEIAGIRGDRRDKPFRGELNHTAGLPEQYVNFL
jgi:hypothetical protein